MLSTTLAHLAIRSTTTKLWKTQKDNNTNGEPKAIINTLKALQTSREVDDEEKKQIRKSISKLRNLLSFPFMALELSAGINEDPDQLLRVCVGLGFKRARLQYVYSILRGKDLDTEQFSEERRVEQFSQIW